MNAFYKARVFYDDESHYEGVATGENLGEITNNIAEYYGTENVIEITLWLSENKDENVIESDEFLDCPIFTN